MTLTLRPYQQRAIDEARAHVIAGRKAPLIVGPTGCGKTAMFSEIARLHVAQGGRVLILAHRVELVEQAYDAVRRVGVDVGAIGDAVMRARDPGAPVQVGMIQTMMARNLRPTATLLIPDEAHHSCADEFLKVISHYPFRVGFTATPERQDGRALGVAFDSLVVAASIRELTEAGHLVPCDVIAPPRKLKSGQIAQSPLAAYREHCGTRRTILFAPHIMAAEEYLADFLADGVRAALVTGLTPAQERRRMIGDFKRGALEVLVNVNVLTEGFDAPETSACILARGCGSPGMYLQIVGRILRPAPGKTDAVLVDLRGVTHDPDIGAPDAERVYSLEGKGISGVTRDDLRFCEVCGNAMDPGVSKCRACGWEPDSAQESPTVVNVPMRKLARDVLAADAPSMRVQRLANWTAYAFENGHKKTAPLAKFRALYGSWPTASEIADARLLNKGHACTA